jgi:hypothetical protein
MQGKLLGEGLLKAGQPDGKFKHWKEFDSTCDDH